MVKRRQRLRLLCGCGSLLAALALATPTISAQSSIKPKRRAAPPSVRDVDHAFQGKTEQPRLKLYLRLHRAEESADQPDLIAALSDGLQQRLDNRTIDGTDLQLISLFGKYSSEEAAQALRRFFQSDDARVILVSLQAMTAADRLPP